MKRIIIGGLVVGWLGCLLFSSVLADVPEKISFQGRVTGVAPGSVSITFSIYDVSSGGQPKWTETQSVTVDDNGIFNVLLGSVTPLSSLPFNEPYYLEISVAGTALSPRQPLTSAPYALRAGSADNDDNYVLKSGGTMTGDLVLNTALTAGGAIKSFTGFIFPDGSTQIKAAGAGDSNWALSGANIYNTNSGNVGIGTTTPAATLDIRKPATSGVGLQIYGGTSNASNHLQWTNSVGVVQGVITNAGNVGIGTSVPDVALDVYNGAIKFNKNLGGVDLSFMKPDSTHWGGLLGWNKSAGEGEVDLISSRGSGSYGGFKFYDINSDGTANVLMVIRGDGNVGIGTGTTAPAAKLHVVGSMLVTGLKNAIVTTESYGTRKLYCVESPGVWFEDYGSAKLENGRVTVTLDPIFRETIDESAGLKVFVQPNGQTSGVYVEKNGAQSFTVIEQNSGTSNIEFDYRIIAKRKGYAETRLEEVK